MGRKEDLDALVKLSEEARAEGEKARADYQTASKDMIARIKKAVGRATASSVTEIDAASARQQAAFDAFMQVTGKVDAIHRRMHKLVVKK